MDTPILLTDVLTLFLSMGGMTTFITMFTNLLGWFGLFKKEGLKGKVATGLQIASLLGIWAAKSFAPEVDLGVVDAYASGLANIGAAILVFIPIVVAAGKAEHKAMAADLPVLGFSNSVGDKPLSLAKGDTPLK